MTVVGWKRWQRWSWARVAVQKNWLGRLDKPARPAHPEKRPSQFPHLTKSVFKPARPILLLEFAFSLRYLCFSCVFRCSCFRAVSLLSLIFVNSSGHQLTYVISVWALRALSVCVVYANIIVVSIWLYIQICYWKLHVLGCINLAGMIAKANNNYPKGYTAKETTFNFRGNGSQRKHQLPWVLLPSTVKETTINLMLPLPRKRPLPWVLYKVNETIIDLTVLLSRKRLLPWRSKSTKEISINPAILGPQEYEILGACTIWNNFLVHITN